MAFTIKFNEEKNQLLKVTRGVSFEDVQNAIETEDLIDDLTHSSKRYPRQRVYVVNIKGYVYAVPYVINEEKQEIFLKTIYPSRRLTKLYLIRLRSNFSKSSLGKQSLGGQEGGKNENKKKI